MKIAVVTMSMEHGANEHPICAFLREENAIEYQGDRERLAKESDAAAIAVRYHIRMIDLLEGYP